MPMANSSARVKCVVFIIVPIVLGFKKVNCDPCYLIRLTKTGGFAKNLKPAGALPRETHENAEHAEVGRRSKIEDRGLRIEDRSSRHCAQGDPQSSIFNL